VSSNIRNAPLAWTGGLAVLTVVYLAWPLYRALFPHEIDLNEFWNAAKVVGLGRGEPLYPPPGSLITNNYPPLSFYAVAALSRLGLDPVMVGRGLSFAGLFVGGLGVAASVAALGGGRLAAAVAGLWFVALTARFLDGYVGMYDPALPALGIFLAALAWFLKRQRDGRAIEPPIVLMAVAGFYKHNMVVVPIASVLYAMSVDWRRGLRAGVAGALVATLGLALCAAAYGDDFIRNMQFPRVIDVRAAFASLGQLQWEAPALVIAILWIVPDRRSPQARFAALFIALAVLFYWLQRLGAGVSTNAHFEVAAASALGVGLAFARAAGTPFARRFGTPSARTAIVAVLILRLLASTRLEPYLVLTSVSYREEFAAHAAIVRTEVERVRSLAPPVECSVGLVCYWAGQPYVYDFFYNQQRIMTGQISRADLDAALRAIGLKRIENDPRTNAESLYRRW
jgi:hypothetical protein